MMNTLDQDMAVLESVPRENGNMPFLVVVDTVPDTVVVAAWGMVVVVVAEGTHHNLVSDILVDKVVPAAVDGQLPYCVAVADANP